LYLQLCVCCIVLWCVAVRCVVLCCVVLCCLVLCCIVCIEQYCAVLYCAAVHCIVLYGIVLHCIALCCMTLQLHCTHAWSGAQCSGSGRTQRERLEVAARPQPPNRYIHTCIHICICFEVESVRRHVLCYIYKHLQDSIEVYDAG
jgi:hypothetical protein